MLPQQLLPPAFLGAEKACPLAGGYEMPEACAPRRDGPGAARIGARKPDGKKEGEKRRFDVGKSIFFVAREGMYPLFLSLLSLLAHSPTPWKANRRTAKKMQTILATRVGVPLASAKAQARSKAAAPAPARIIGANKSLGACPCLFLFLPIRSGRSGRFASCLLPPSTLSRRRSLS